MRSRRWRSIQSGLPESANGSPKLVKHASLVEVDGMSRDMSQLKFGVNWIYISPCQCSVRGLRFCACCHGLRHKKVAIGYNCPDSTEPQLIALYESSRARTKASADWNRTWGYKRRLDLLSLPAPIPQWMRR